MSFTISGLEVSGRTRAISAAISPRSLPITQPDLTFGTGDVQLQGGHLGAVRHRLHEGRELLVGEAGHAHDQGHRERRQLGQVAGEEALQALVGQADGVDQPGRGLPQPRRGVAAPRGERDRLGDEGRERAARSRAGAPKVRIAAIASQVPGAVQDGMGEAQPRELDLEARAAGAGRLSFPALLEVGGRDHGAVHAQPPVAVPRAHHAAEAGAEAACHAGLERELRRAPSVRRRSAAPPRASAAARTRTPRRPARARASSSSVTRPWWPAPVPSSVATAVSPSNSRAASRE